MTLPRPNLPNNAQPWGRAVTDATNTNSVELGRLRESLKSENRAFAGQMGAVGRQVTELGSRETRIVTASSLTVTASSSSFVSGTRNIAISGVGSDARHAIVVVSAPASRSGDVVGPFVTLRFNNQIVFRDTVGQSTGGRVPPDWGNSLTTTFSVVVPPGGGTLSIQMQVAIFSGSSGSATLSDPVVATYFTDRQINVE